MLCSRYDYFARVEDEHRGFRVVQLQNSCRELLRFMVERLGPEEMRILGALTAGPLGHRRLMDETEFQDKVLRRIYKSLVKRRFLRVNRKDWKRGKSKPYCITKAGEAVHIDNADADKAIDQMLYAFGQKGAKEQVDAFQSVFVFLYVTAYKRFYEQGKVEDYAKLLNSIIEKPVSEFLNKDASAQLKNIKDGAGGGLYLDPYLLIDRLNLRALYEDAILAKRKGHFLTENHIMALTRSDDFKEEPLVDHNKDWNQKSVNTRKPYEAVRREREERRQVLGQKFSKYYEHLERTNYAHNEYQHDRRWSI